MIFSHKKEAFFKCCFLILLEKQRAWNKSGITCTNNEISFLPIVAYCADLPCQFGTCYEVADGFTCACDPGYDGLTCDNGKKYPSPLPFISFILVVKPRSLRIANLIAVREPKEITQGRKF